MASVGWPGTGDAQPWRSRAFPLPRPPERPEPTAPARRSALNRRPGALSFPLGSSPTLTPSLAGLDLSLSQGGSEGLRPLGPQTSKLSKHCQSCRQKPSTKAQSLLDERSPWRDRQPRAAGGEPGGQTASPKLWGRLNRRGWFDNGDEAVLERACRL